MPLVTLRHRQWNRNKSVHFNIYDEPSLFVDISSRLDTTHTTCIYKRHVRPLIKKNPWSAGPPKARDPWQMPLLPLGHSPLLPRGWVSPRYPLQRNNPLSPTRSLPSPPPRLSQSPLPTTEKQSLVTHSATPLSSPAAESIPVTHYRETLPCHPPTQSLRIHAVTP